MLNCSIAQLPNCSITQLLDTRDSLESDMSVALSFYCQLTLSVDDDGLSGIFYEYCQHILIDAITYCEWIKSIGLRGSYYIRSFRRSGGIDGFRIIFFTIQRNKDHKMMNNKRFTVKLNNCEIEWSRVICGDQYTVD